MQRNFDLHVSVQFKGGQYFRSFSAKTYTEFENGLRDAWYDTGLSIRTGEIFIFTTVDLEDGPYEFELGHYKVEEDNETIIGITSIPEPGSPEHIICTILNIDISDPSLKFNEESFFNAVTRAIVKHQKSWAELSQATHKKIEKLERNLEKAVNQRLKKEAYYQCTSCNWIGSGRERLVQYFDFNQEPAHDPKILRDRLNSGRNHNPEELWLKASYLRLCPKCQKETKPTEDGEKLFTKTMQKIHNGFTVSSFGGLFKDRENPQELARIELCWGNEESRICCNPSELYEVIRFKKLSKYYEEIVENDGGRDLFSNQNEVAGSILMFDAIYIEVFLENFRYWNPDNSE